MQPYAVVLKYIAVDCCLRRSELLPRLKVRLRTSNAIAWRVDGPVRRTYEQQVTSEFLRAEFRGRNELLNFGSAELSSASATILARKVEALARDFADLAALDASLPDTERRSMGMLLALRPWVCFRCTRDCVVKAECLINKGTGSSYPARGAIQFNED